MVKTWVKNSKAPSLDESNLQSLSDVIERLDYFRKISKRGIGKLSKRQRKKFAEDLATYFRDWGYWTDFLDNNLHFFRATINKNILHVNEKHLSKVSHLTGPPKPSMLRLGRCNGLKIPIFYAADTINTAIQEVSPAVGDYITLSRWQLKPGVKLFYHTIFHPSVVPRNEANQGMFENYMRSQSSDLPTRSAIYSENNKFLTEEFTKIVDNKNPENYLITSIFSENLFSFQSTIQAIAYPSTKFRNGQYNIALADSLVHTRFNLLNVTVLKVDEITPSPDLHRDRDYRFSEVEYLSSFDVAQDLLGQNWEAHTDKSDQ